MQIKFHFLKLTRLANRNNLKKFLLTLSRTENTEIEMLDVIFCSDEYLLTINKSFLNHHYYTDIITFDLTPKNQKAKIGEIYISIDRIKSNAKEFNTTLTEECHRVIFHGLLHLCGFKDKTKKDKLLMTQKENEYLSKYFH